MAEGFGFATEADADSYTIDTQYYLCTEVHLADADPHFGATGVGGIGAQHGATGTGSGIGTAKNLHTPDDGLTWLVDLITLPAMNPQGTQTAPPTFSCSSASVDAGTPSDAGAADASTGADATAGADATTHSDASAGEDATSGSDARAGLDATTGSDASGGSDAAGRETRGDAWQRLQRRSRGWRGLERLRGRGTSASGQQKGEATVRDDVGEPTGMRMQNSGRLLLESRKRPSAVCASCRRHRRGTPASPGPTESDALPP